MKTYLIARAKIEDRDYKNGVDSIISLSYMGASEYEWGVMPNSLKAIRNSINEYTYLDIPLKDQVITVFCNESQKSEVLQYLKEIASGKMNTKNGNHFDWYMKNSNKSDMMYVRECVDFWWDLQNDLMFWIKDSAFESKFKEVIKTNPK